VESPAGILYLLLPRLLQLLLLLLLLLLVMLTC
jgi:hypothetical protein